MADKAKIEQLLHEAKAAGVTLDQVVAAVQQLIDNAKKPAN